MGVVKLFWRLNAISAITILVGLVGRVNEWRALEIAAMIILVICAFYSFTALKCRYCGHQFWLPADRESKIGYFFGISTIFPPARCKNCNRPDY